MKKLILVFMVIAASASAQRLSTTTGDAIVQTVRDRGIYLDSIRFPKTLIQRFVNDGQLVIATLGRTNPAESTYALEDNILQYALPDQFMLPSAAILNPDPTQPVNYQNYAKALQYVAPEAWGKTPPAAFNRPYQWTMWNDSIKFSSARSEVDDTVSFEYFRYPVALDTITDTIDIPERYIPLLKEYVINYCLSRILMIGPEKDRNEAAIKYYEMQLLGRPEDAK